jgi:hypothetical protein
VHNALKRPSAHDTTGASSSLTGILAHLDTVYGFALTLSGDPERAGALTERAFASVHDDLWSTLGGHSLRDRLLARCVCEFTETVAGRGPGWFATADPSVVGPDRLRALLRGLPWDERAAIALVDQLGLSRSDAAAVLGIGAAEFRALLHRGRSVLFAAYRAGAR